MRARKLFKQASDLYAQSMGPSGLETNQDYLDKALSLIQKILPKTRYHFGALLLKGYILCDLGQYKKAALAVQQSLRHCDEKQRESALMCLAHIEFDRGNYKRAKQLLLTLILEGSKDTELLEDAYDSLVSIARIRGRNSEAKQWVRTGIRMLKKRNAPYRLLKSHKRLI